MATLNKIKKGQTVTEEIEYINSNVENINDELVELHTNVENNTAGYITSAEAPVQSVNGSTGDVVLGATDVGAFPNSSTATALDINNTKATGVYIGTYQENPVYLLVIKYSDNNIYQELIGSNFKKYRRFTTSWSDWIEYYSNEKPITASDVTGINTYDSNTVLDVALLNSGTFVKTNLKYNASTGSLWFGTSEFATKGYVDNAVNMIHSIIVNELPSTGVENTIYYVPDTTPETSNAYLEYVYVNNAWELLGATEVDLTPFLTKDEASQTYATKTENDGKVSKTTTVNGKALSTNITLTASDVGALPSNTPIPADLVHRYDNSTIASMLTGGDFTEGDTLISTDAGTYLKGHIYLFTNNALVDITDIPNDYVALTGNQDIAGTKNFTGILRYGGVAVATSSDISTVESHIPTVNNNTITIQKNGSTVDSFTLNQNSDKSINITTPLNTSELTNDGDGISYQEHDGYSEFDSTSDYIGYYVLISDTYTLVTSENKDTLSITAGTTKAYEYSPYATKQYVADNGGKIDTISVNGTPQTITNKNVNITTPTKTSDLTNDGNGTSNFATESYVAENGGKIDAIKVNGATQTITNKVVDITVPTKVSDLTNDSGFITSSSLSTKKDTDAVAIAQFFTDNPSFKYNGNPIYLKDIAGKSLLDADVQAYLTALNTKYGTFTNTSVSLIPYTSTMWAVLQTNDYQTYTLYYTLPDQNTIRHLSPNSSYVFVETLDGWLSDLTNKANRSELPTATSDLNNDSGFITNAVNDLTYYTLSTGVGTTIDLEINSSTYVVTASLKNSSGTVLSSDTIDLPLESVVVSGSYDDTTEKIILTLQSGSTVEFSVADLVSGLQSEITSSNKLSSDLVDDTNKTNKFVTTSEKSTWNGKQDAITSSNKLDYSLIDNTPTLPTVNNGTLTIQKNGTTAGTFTANQSGNTTVNITVPDDTGATSIETTGSGNVVSSASYDGTTRKITLTKGVTALTSHQDISGKLDKVSTNNTVYGVDGSGNQTNYTVANSSSTGNAVAKYDSSGRLKSATPSANDDVANKSYVDGAIPSAITSVEGLSGGTITGNTYIKGYFGITNASNQTAASIDQNGDINARYVQGTWLYASNATDTASWTDVWVNSGGWLYKRAKSSFKSDLGVPNVWSGTQAQYDAITNKDSNTYYFIEEE